MSQTGRTNFPVSPFVSEIDNEDVDDIDVDVDVDCAIKADIGIVESMFMKFITTKCAREYLHLFGAKADSK